MATFTNKRDRPPINVDEASIKYYKWRKAKNQETVPSGTKAITKNVDKENAPSYMKKTTKPSASTMDGNAYTPTQLKPVGPNMSKINRNTTDNKKPSTKKKSRGLVTMPSMQNKYL